MSHLPTDQDQEFDLLEARLGATLAQALKGEAERLPSDVQTRLRFAREQALERARASRPRPVLLGAGTTAALGRSWLGWQHLAPWAAALMLALGFTLIGEWQVRERAQVAAEVDALLLADQLPPAAYADPGFVAFLKLAQP